MSPRTRNLLFLLGVPLVIVAAVWVWWTRGDSPAEVDINAALSEAEASGAPLVADTPSDGADTSPTPTSAPTVPAGEQTTWAVTTNLVNYDFAEGTGTFVGFRIEEELNDEGAVTAVARTPDVTGGLTQQGTTITAANFTADLTTLNSDRSRRNNAIQRALNTTSNPEATFTLTTPVDLGAQPPIGEQVAADATGELTINGVTNEVTIPLRAAITAQDELVVTGSWEVALDDYDIEEPSAPIVLGVSDTATIEIQLWFTM